MKKIYVSVILIITCFSSSFGQMLGELFTGTIKPGSSTTSAMIAIKSSATFNGQITNLQFTIQVPNTISPQPTVTIKSNPLNTYVPTGNYLTQIDDEGGFYNYLFAATTSGSPVYSFTSGTEIDALEVEFSGANGQMSDVRLAQVANGGTSTNLNFYIEVSGNENTNATSSFYGTGAVNSTLPAYTGYSYVPLANVVLPIILTNFSAVRNNMDGILTWQISNQDANSAYFELERSFTGTDFTKIGRVEVNLNSGSTGSYTFNDIDIGKTKSNGVIFYRIKMVDKDGKFTYSQVRSIRLTSKSFGVNLYPNPAKNFSNASIEIDNPANIILSISDASGKTVQQIEFAGYKGLNQKRIDLSRLASGSYLIKVNSGNDIQTISLLKQ